jgi:hypothetical protein
MGIAVVVCQMYPLFLSLLDNLSTTLDCSYFPIISYSSSAIPSFPTPSTAMGAQTATKSTSQQVSKVQDAVQPNPVQPSVARMYDYYLGGTTNYSVDRQAVAEVAKAMPDCFNLCLENRSFLRRAVRFMSKQGITQFIDIGSGLPTKSNTHEVAQAANPSAKIVYVDMDPVVLAEGKALLSKNVDTTTIICADVRQPDAVLEHPELNRLVDFSKPVGVLMMFVDCFWTDKEIAYIMGAIRSKAAPGSFIAATHDTYDGKQDDVGAVERVKEVYAETPIPIYFRSAGEVAAIFEGLELVQPGLVMLDEWHVEMDDVAPVATKWLYGGIGKTVAEEDAVMEKVDQYSWFAAFMLRLRSWSSAIFRLLL